MALLFVDSFDHYQSANLLSKWTTNVFASTIGVGRGRCDTNGVVLGTFQDLVKGLAFGSTRGTVGFAFQIDASSTLTTGTISFASVGNAYTTHLDLRWNPDGSLEVMRPSGGGVSLGMTAPGLVAFDQWYFIEWQMVPHASAGLVIVRLNNSVVLSVSGVNTAADSGAAELRQIGFHCAASQSFVVDDLYVLDSTGSAPQNDFLGDCRVEYLRPRAAGSLQQWTPVGTSTHWSAVDDNATPDDDTTYLEATTAGLTDTQLYQPTGLPSGPIFGAQLNLYAKKSEIGPRVIAPVAAGVTGASLTAVSADTYQYYVTPYGLNPATGLAWTIAEINAAAFGVTVVS